jgi:amino acid transporter
MTEKPTVFVRRATGLTREVGPLDYFLYAVANPNLSGITYLYLWMAITFFGANMSLATVLSAIVCFFFITVCAMFSATFPRTDAVPYVSSTRVSIPPLGFALSWSWAYAVYFFAAWTGWAFSSIGLADAFTIIGYLYNIPSLVSLSSFTTSPAGIMILGTIVIVFSFLLQILGMRFYYRVLNPLTIIAIISAGVLVVVLGTATSEQFVSSFNGFMRGYAPEIPNYYNYVVKTAQESGYSFTGFNWTDTVGAMTMPFFALAFMMTACLQAGELRGANSFRVQASTLNGALILMSILMALSAFFSTRLFGQEFIGSVGWLFYVAPDKLALPAPPYIQLLAGLVTSPPIAIFVAVGFVVWHLIYAIALAAMLPRIFFAWSFDRLLPEWISRINRRLRTPVNNYITCIVIIEIALVLYVFTPWPHVLNTFMVNGVMFTLICLCAVIFPWRRPELFNASPIPKKAPWVVFGILGAIGMATITYFFVTVGPLGINDPFSLAVAIWLAFCIAPIYWLAARAYRRRQGIDIDLLYKEIPPA